MHLYLRFVLRHRLRCNSQVNLLENSPVMNLGKVNPQLRKFIAGFARILLSEWDFHCAKNLICRLLTLCYGMVAPCLVPMMLCGGFKWFLRSSRSLGKVKHMFVTSLFGKTGLKSAPSPPSFMSSQILVRSEASFYSPVSTSTCHASCRWSTLRRAFKTCYKRKMMQRPFAHQPERLTFLMCHCATWNGKFEKLLCRKCGSYSGGSWCYLTWGVSFEKGV